MKTKQNKISRELIKQHKRNLKEGRKMNRLIEKEVPMIEIFPTQPYTRNEEKRKKTNHIFTKDKLDEMNNLEQEFNEAMISCLETSPKIIDSFAAGYLTNKLNDGIALVKKIK